VIAWRMLISEESVLLCRLTYCPERPQLILSGDELLLASFFEQFKVPRTDLLF
jgi:hypothetical protein